MKKVLILLLSLSFMESVFALTEEEKREILYQKNQECIEREAPLKPHNRPYYDAFTRFPTAPPAGTAYETIHWFDDYARIYLWEENDALYVCAEPITAEFFLCSSSFTVTQNGIYYEYVTLKTRDGNNLCEDITSSVVVEFTCWSFVENCFNIGRSFEVRFDGDTDQYFTYHPSTEQYSYYIPYFSSLSGWFSGIGLSNCSASQAATVSVTIYSMSGTVVNSESASIPLMGQKGWVVGLHTNTTGWMMVESNQPLTGLCFITTVGARNYMADIPMVRNTATTLHIPHVAQNEQWDTTVLICNPNDTSATLTITYHDENGQPDQARNYSVPARGGRNCELSDIIDSTGVERGKVVINSTHGIAAFALYNNLKNDGRCYAGISAVEVE